MTAHRERSMPPSITRTCLASAPTIIASPPALASVATKTSVAVNVSPCDSMLAVAPTTPTAMPTKQTTTVISNARARASAG